MASPKHFHRGPLRSTVRSEALLGEVVEGQNASVGRRHVIWSLNRRHLYGPPIKSFRIQETVLRISAGDVSTVRRPKRSLRLVIGSNTCALPKIATTHNCIKVLLVDKLCCNTSTRDQKACRKKPSHSRALSWILVSI